MATKEQRKQAKGLIENLESRVHAGPPIATNELLSARDFLLERDFSPASDYFSRLAQIQDRLQSRNTAPAALPGKRNYGGMAGGYWMQLQSAYDHIIVSTCYEGEFNLRRGRAKVSHRFNKEGRIDFVEMKFLRSLDPLLNGALRKLLTVKEFQTCRKDWGASEAYVLDVLPREMIFLYPDIFRFPKDEVLAWTVNVGHRLMGDLLHDLQSPGANGFSHNGSDETGQLPLHSVRSDEVALPILRKAAQLESAVEVQDSRTAVIRYVHVQPRLNGS